MASPTDIHDDGKDSAGPQDVFHTPPEESSLHYSSDEQRPAVAADADLYAVNQAVEVGGSTQAFVDLCSHSDVAEFADLGRDSDLGFSEAEVVDPEIVVADGAAEDSECKVDEIWVSEREFHGSCEFLVKKLEVSEKDLGFGSSADFLGVESQKEGNSVGNCKGKLVSDADAVAETPCDFVADLEPQENVMDGENCCREVSVDKNLGSIENVEIQVVQTEIKESAEAEKFLCAAEENESSDKIVEASRTKEKSDGEPKKRVLPPSFRVILDDAAKELESEKCEKKDETCAFKVLKYLSENVVEDEEDLGNINWAEVLKRSGVTFPRPRWWPEHFENSSGLVLE